MKDDGTESEYISRTVQVLTNQSGKCVYDFDGNRVLVPLALTMAKQSLVADCVARRGLDLSSLGVEQLDESVIQEVYGIIYQGIDKHIDARPVTHRMTVESIMEAFAPIFAQPLELEAPGRSKGNKSAPVGMPETPREQMLDSFGAMLSSGHSVDDIMGLTAQQFQVAASSIWRHKFTQFSVVVNSLFPSKDGKPSAPSRSGGSSSFPASRLPGEPMRELSEEDSRKFSQMMGKIRSVNSMKEDKNKKKQEAYKKAKLAAKARKQLTQGSDK